MKKSLSWKGIEITENAFLISNKTPTIYLAIDFIYAEMHENLLQFSISETSFGYKILAPFLRRLQALFLVVTFRCIL